MTNPPTRVATPIETKVVAASWTGVLSTFATWMLVTYIPAWHTGIPPQIQPLIPALVAVVLSTLAGYCAKHTPRLDEVYKTALILFRNPVFLKELETVVAAEEKRKPATETSAMPDHE